MPANSPTPPGFVPPGGTTKEHHPHSPSHWAHVALAKIERGMNIAHSVDLEVIITEAIENALSDCILAEIALAKEGSSLKQLMEYMKTEDE